MSVLEKIELGKPLRYFRSLVAEAFLDSVPSFVGAYAFSWHLRTSDTSDHYIQPILSYHSYNCSGYCLCEG